MGRERRGKEGQEWREWGREGKKRRKDVKGREQRRERGAPTGHGEDMKSEELEEGRERWKIRLGDKRREEEIGKRISSAKKRLYEENDE